MMLILWENRRSYLLKATQTEFGGEIMIEALSFQEAISGNHCYGCGPQNAKGFRIQSFWEGDESVCTWEPEPHHAAGPKDVLNGGVIATLIDCHCLCTVVAAAYREEGRQIGSSPIIWYVTGSLQVSYLKPTAINKPVTLRAKVQKTKNLPLTNSGS